MLDPCADHPDRADDDGRVRRQPGRPLPPLAGLERQQLKWLAAAAAVVAVTYLIVEPLSVCLDPAANERRSGCWWPRRWPAQLRADPGRHRRGDPALPALRDRRDHPPDAGVRGAGRDPGRGLPGRHRRGRLAAARRRGAIQRAGGDRVDARRGRGFQPLRRRIQHAVDRRFYRRSYDAQAAVAGFSSRLREQVDLDAIAADLVGTTEATVSPRTVSVWLRSPS